MTGDGAVTNISTIAQLREDISLTREFAYFQTGSAGPASDSTQRVVLETLKQENGVALGGGNAYAPVGQVRPRALRALSRLLHASEQNLAFTLNTSTSTQLAARSLPWKPGDRLALSGAEHISTRIMAQAVEQITGTPTTIIPVGDGSNFTSSRFLSELDRNLTPDHNLLVISLVSCIDGRRLPVHEATQMAHARGVKVLVDGAQAVGQFSVDIGELDPEFFAGSVHKWLLGPAGVGYLYVADRELPSFCPYLLPAVRKSGDECIAWPLNATSRTHTGTETMSILAGACHAIETFLCIGLDQIEDRIRTLTGRLRAGLRRLDGFRILTPDAWALSSGITSLEFPGWTPEQVHALIDRIWEEYRVVVKFQTDFAGIRISVAPFNTEEEVDRLLSALEKLIPCL